ncbi:MAG TPA: hypothetical protein VEJ16_03450 [Alphaproteobacteria bacterium]|nr:hypothetical protein [Alphaproteobacteria bacterium]
MIDTPPQIMPLNVFEDIVQIAQCETPLDDRLMATGARIDQFVSDLEDHGKQHRTFRKTKDVLKSQLRHRLKAAANRWIGMEEVRVFKEALTRLAVWDDPEFVERLH